MSVYSGFAVSGFVRSGSGRGPFGRARSAAAVVLVGLAGVGLVGTQAASATTAASPAGSYTATLMAPKESSVQDALTLTAKGHFSFTSGPKGTWMESGTAITMTGKYKKTTYGFTIDQHGTDLGSKAHPGLITANGQTIAKWYAVPSGS
jgi:hypothetical protein